MSTTVTVAGQSFTVAATGDYNWGDNISNLLIKLATSTAVLQSTSTTFSLSGGDLDFGANYSIKSLSYKSRAANPSSTGIVRLGNAESIGWRNQANNGDLALKVNASDLLEYNGNTVLDSAGSGLTGLITNSMVNASAGIAYSKLSLANSISNADISSSATIAYSKLNLSGSIVNADINASAAIALSKLAALSTGKVLQSNASTGAIEASSVTNTILSYLDATSSIQTQLDAKVAKSTLTTAGDMFYATGASTPARLPVGSESQVLKVVAGTPTWANFSGGINYITATDGTAIGSWTTYADAAGTTPVDGTGGSPSSTYAVSTDSSLRGTSNFLWTHSAANRQGEGFSYNFTIDPSDKGKVLQASFDYLIASGTYADDDLQFWIYDVTNSTLIQPAPYKLKNSSIVEKFAFEFQTASNSTSYRLIGHVATSTATAYTIRFDNWNLGPQAKLYGSPITDAVAYTPTFTGFGSVSNINVKSQRIGDSLRVFGYFQTGTNTGTTALMTLGYGGVNGNVNIDTNKIGDTVIIGSAASTESASATYFLTAPLSGTTNAVKWGRQTSTATVTAAANGNAWSNNAYISFDFIVPIQGWSSSQVMSSDADTRVVAATAVRTSSNLTINTTATDVVFNSATADTHGAMNTSTGVYTIPVSGWYEFDSNIRIDTGGSAPTQFVFEYVVNGSGTIVGAPTDLVASKTYYFNPTHQNFFNAGTTIKLRITSATNASTLIADQSYLYAKRISGPSQILASDTVAALYTGAPPTGTLTSSFNTTTFGSKVKDSHGAYSSGTYTVPTSGVYDLSAQTMHTATYSLGNISKISIFIDGVEKYDGIVVAGGAQTYTAPSINIKSIPLLAGQLITIRSYDNGTTPSFVSDATANFFSITRTGNY